jgi:FkbM family methyltransferase
MARDQLRANAGASPAAAETPAAGHKPAKTRVEQCWREARVPTSRTSSESAKKDVQTKIDQYWHMEKPKGDRVESRVEMETVTLAAVLEQHRSKFSEIEFINVDVEGFELEVLESNDWQTFRPKMILVEDYTFDIEHLGANAVHQFLREQGYAFFSRNMITNFYLRDGVTRVNA